MKFYAIEQRGEEWHKLRLGHPTASQFGRIISGTTGNLKKATSELYMAELVAERIFKRPMHRDISNIPAVRHGTETEPEAARALEERIGPLQPGGFMTDDLGRYGASPDGLLVAGNRRELAEIKSPHEIPQHVRTLLYGISDDHRAQVQGQLLVSGYDVCHFWSFHASCPSYYRRVERDDPFLRKLDTLLDDFCRELEENYQRALAMGAWGT